MVDKGVILARGLGTRMRAMRPSVRLRLDAERAAAEGAKTLIPIGGRPLLDYIVDSMLAAGIRRLCLVVPPQADELQRHAARIAAAAGISVDCAVQQDPLGTADATLAAEPFVGSDSFILTNGDNVFRADTVRAVAACGPGGCAVGAFPLSELTRGGTIGSERISKFAVLDTVDGRLRAIIEKPDDPSEFARGGELLVSMNLYRFTPDILAFCRSVTPDPVRGELELTRAVTDLIGSGTVEFHVASCVGPVLDLTSRSDVAAAERVLESRRLSF
jgi:glucose-1-phosphate thymidylyltransferase